MSRRISAVAFDVDGTLYPNGPMYLRSIPLFLGNARILSHFGAVRRTLREARPDGDFHELQAKLLAKRIGTTPAAAAAWIESTVHTQWESLLERVAPYERAIALIQELSGRGVPLGVVSDFPVRTKLARLGLEGYWDTSFSSEEVGYLKPNPEPFGRLVSDLGVPREELLYIGNSYENDVRGAKNAGLMAAHICRRPPRGTCADFTFSRFEQLREWLREKVR